jgi:hypothetical protein
MRPAFRRGGNSLVLGDRGRFDEQRQPRRASTLPVVGGALERCASAMPSASRASSSRDAR